MRQKKAKRITLLEAREEVKKDYLQIMQVNRCSSPQQMQLGIIFRMLYNYLYTEARANMDEDGKGLLNYQKALFDQMTEEQYKIDGLNKMKGF